jgi:hypothetical protein
MTAPPVGTKRRVERETMCAVYAQACGEQALGHAGHPDAYFLFELPTPWPHRIFESREDLRALQALRMRLYEGGFLLAAVGVAPDREYSQPETMRVVHLRRPTGPFARFEREEYLLPAEGTLFPLAEALFDRPDQRPAFQRYRVPAREGRDLLVCTHGSVDICCGTFGYPTYQSLRQKLASNPAIRVWRASHFGGHRFAPTVLDLPEGRYWGFLTDTALEQIVRRTGPVESILPHYRGWAGLDSVWAQIAEGEAFRRESWDWIDYQKRSTTFDVDADEQKAAVRIDFAGVDGRVRGCYEATVEVSEVKPLPLCGERPEEAHYEGKEYRLVEFSRVT